VFAPAAKIDSAAGLPTANIAGDLPMVDYAARVVVSERLHGGLLHIFIGDFDRSINNPGVGIVYGLLYGAFGAFATTAFPWNAVATGLTALIVMAMGQLSAATDKLFRGVAITIVLLPTFFVAPPLYRDQFIILLIVLTCYAAFHAIQRRSVLSALTLIACGAMLGSLRGPYVLLPALALGAVAFSPFLQGRTRIGLALLSVVAALMYGASFFVPPEWLTALEERIAESYQRGASGSVEMLLGGGIVAKTAFIMLTPMPWYQGIPTWLLAYQVFDYAQTVVSLTILTCIVLMPVRALQHNPRSFALVFGAAIFGLALIAQDLHQRYAQVALPLILFGGAHIVRNNWRAGFGGSVAIISLAHVVVGLLR
jgi:hypothetical protein